VKDTVPPVISLTSHTNNQPVGGIFTLEGTASDVGQGIKKIYVKVGTNDWKIASLSGKYWSYDVSAGTNLMSHTLFIYAEDKANNYSRTITNTVVRVAMPSLYAMYPQNGIITNMTNILIGGMTAMDTYGSNTNVMVQINGGVWTQANNLEDWTNFSFNAYFLQVTNTYRIKVYGTTPFIADSGLRTVIVDNQPPVFVSVNYANYQTVLSTPYQLQLLYQDSMIGVSNVYLRLNGGSYNPIGYSSPYWISNISENALIAHVWKSYAMDRFNNPSYTNQTVIFRKNFTIQEFVPYLNGMPTNFHENGSGNSIAVSGDGNTIIAPIPGKKVIRLHWDGSVWQTNIFAPIYFPASTYFGVSIASTPDGNTFIVGDRNGTNQGGYNTGYVYMFKKIGAAWTTNLFYPTDYSSGSPDFGFSVDISDDGNAFVVGACTDSEKYSVGGSAYYFKWNGTNWTTNKFFAYDASGPFEYFGHSVSITPDGNTFIIGAKGKSAVYRMQWTNNMWITNKFSGAGTFGAGVSVSADGKKFAASSPSSKYVYRFYWTVSSWTSNVLIVHDLATTGDNTYYAWKLAISSNGNTIVFSDYYNSEMKILSQPMGAVYRFYWTGSSWTTNKIFPYDPSMTMFGYGVACSPEGKTIWVKGDKIYKFTSEW
jgi:hypothetical protein